MLNNETPNNPLVDSLNKFYQQLQRDRIKKSPVGYSEPVADFSDSAKAERYFSETDPEINESVTRGVAKILRGGRAMLRARNKPLLPSNISHAIHDHNHARQGIIPYGFGTGPSEYKARRGIFNAREDFNKEEQQVLENRRQNSHEKLKQMYLNMRQQYYNNEILQGANE